MATSKKSNKCVVVGETKIEVPKKVESDFKLYPLKIATKIGGVLRPIGFEIPLSKDGYRYYKQKNIV